MEERRGRPKIGREEDLPKKFTKIFKDKDLISTWKYDLDLSPNGPIEVNNEWINEPEGDNILKIIKVDNSKYNINDIPKTKRRYLNPNNGKYVGYTRAKMLGLVK